MTTSALKPERTATNAGRLPRITALAYWVGVTLVVLLGCGEPTQIYVVSLGDTGLGIAHRLEIPFRELARLNPGEDWNRLQPGQPLTIPRLERRVTTAPPVEAETAPHETTKTGQVTGIVIVYRGDRLETINPRVVTESGSVLLDNLPILGVRLVHSKSEVEGRAIAGSNPLILEGRSTARHTVELDASSANLFNRLEEWRPAPGSPVVFCRVGPAGLSLWRS